MSKVSQYALIRCLKQLSLLFLNVMKTLFKLLFLVIATLSVAQEDVVQNMDVHLREIPKYNLALDMGVAQPLGTFNDYAGSGLTIGLTFEACKNKHWGMSIAARHQSNQSMARNANFISDAPTVSFEHSSLAIGPVYSYTRNRFQLDIAPRLGVQFLNKPVDNRYAGSDGAIIFPIQLDSTNASNAALYGELTTRFNYYFRRSVQVFAAPTFTTTFGEPYSFTNSPANVAVNPSNFLFIVGVKIALGPKYSNGELRDDSL